MGRRRAGGPKQRLMPQGASGPRSPSGGPPRTPASRPARRPATGQKPYQVVFSYHGVDSDLAAAVYAELLDRLGPEAIFDYKQGRRSVGRRGIWSHLEPIYRNARVAVIIAGPNYERSNFCQWEKGILTLRANESRRGGEPPRLVGFRNGKGSLGAIGPYHLRASADPKEIAELVIKKLQQQGVPLLVPARHRNAKPRIPETIMRHLPGAESLFIDHPAGLAREALRLLAAYMDVASQVRKRCLLIVVLRDLNDTAGALESKKALTETQEICCRLRADVRRLFNLFGPERSKGTFERQRYYERLRSYIMLHAESYLSEVDRLASLIESLFLMDPSLLRNRDSAQGIRAKMMALGGIAGVLAARLEQAMMEDGPLKLLAARIPKRRQLAAALRQLARVIEKRWRLRRRKGLK
jgi:hypothetical protein